MDFVYIYMYSVISCSAFFGGYITVTRKPGKCLKWKVNSFTIKHSSWFMNVFDVKCVNLLIAFDNSAGHL